MEEKVQIISKHIQLLTRALSNVGLNVLSQYTNRVLPATLDDESAFFRAINGIDNMFNAKRFGHSSHKRIQHIIDMVKLDYMDLLDMRRKKNKAYSDSTRTEIMNIKRYIDKRVKNEIKQLRRHIRRDSVNIPGVIREILALCKEFISEVGGWVLFVRAMRIVNRILLMVDIIQGVRNEIELAKISKKLEKLNYELQHEMMKISFRKNSKEDLKGLDNKRAEAERLIAERATRMSKRIEKLIVILIREISFRMSREPERFA